MVKHWSLFISPQIFQTGFQPTYEWNIHIQHRGRSSRCFSLPMRNWMCRRNIRATCPTMFSAYLWGIETRNRRQDKTIWWRFQPTYENETGYHYLILQNIFCFQPTYRIETVDVSLPCCGPFSPTYEELKRQLPLTPSYGFSVSAYLWGLKLRDN